MFEGKLSLARLFQTPNLNGPVPTMARYSPDGVHIAYLRLAEDAHQRLDLWLYHLATRQNRLLLGSQSETRQLSAEEQARRERLRIFASGVVEFLWTADSAALLIPLSGRLYRLTITEDDGALTPITPQDWSITHPQVCATTGNIGFVCQQNLWLLEDAGEPPRQLTHDGGGLISLGTPDFIAAEEMHRFSGYFFSPKGTCIAVQRTDESSIPETHRYEIDGNGFKVQAQRYPAAGMANARVDLEIITLADGSRRRLNWQQGLPEDVQAAEYLARIHWLPDESGLLVQRQDRKQQHLQLVHLGLDGSARLIHSESSSSWINLCDDLHVLQSGQQALWSSEQDGTRRLLLLDLQQGKTRPLGDADMHLLRLVTVNEAAGCFWVESNAEHAPRRQLYRGDLQTGKMHRISAGEGSCSARLAPDGSSILLHTQSLRQPPALLLTTADGAHLDALVANDPEQADHPYHPFLRDHIIPEFGTLTAADGARLHYRLTRPPQASGSTPAPVIVSVYGGPGAQLVTDSWPPLLHEYFAQRGWGVLELDNRGSTGRGRHFEAPIYQQLGTVEVTDQLLGVEHLHSLDWVDARRIAIFGHSYGGYMALMCLAQQPQKFCAAVSVAPVTDWALYDTHYTERYLGLPAENPQGYEQSGVLAWLDGLQQAPPGSLLLMHGMADDNVLFSHSTRLMQALQDRGIMFEFMAYPGSRHGLSETSVRRHRFAVIEQFLQRRFTQVQG